MKKIDKILVTSNPEDGVQYNTSISVNDDWMLDGWCQKTAFINRKQSWMVKKTWMKENIK